MSSSKRDRLRREIFETGPVERLVAVAILMMRWQRTDLPLDAVSAGVARVVSAIPGLSAWAGASALAHVYKGRPLSEASRMRELGAQGMRIAKALNIGRASSARHPALSRITVEEAGK